MVFDDLLRREGATLTRRGMRVLQVNVGKRCNQACHHCHVEAGPLRTEQMTHDTAEMVVDAIARLEPGTVDITGGAPELNPNFRFLVESARSLGCHVIDRCNLTVLLLAEQCGTAAFLARHGVEVIASLPCYSEENVDAQRGRGVFDASIEALRRLNALGYGEPGRGLDLNLVYNPLGTRLPPSQASLEEAYRRELFDRYGVRFTRLYTLANLPIGRFAESLRRSGEYDAYLELLANAFNAATLDGLMCRDTVSVGWDGRLYDCDFNQMLGLPMTSCGRIVDLMPEHLEGRPIVTGDHCMGCTAGAGSSCGGALVG